MKAHRFCISLRAISFYIISIVTLFSVEKVSAFQVSTPLKVTQGDPFVITITDAAPSDVSGTFLGTALNFFTYKDTTTSIFGVDLGAKIGTQEMRITHKDGRVESVYIEIVSREKPEVVFDAPTDFGGNTTDGAKKTISALSKDNQILSKSLWSNKRKLWTEPFVYPLKETYITDTYGYSRSTAGSTITHKGTDFRAKEGTEVYAMNRGVVRLARKLTVYGNTVVIDHGQGTMTMYMHLSSVSAKQGHIIEQGEILGYSGSTGYSQGPHLHLSVRVSNKSVDPEKFLKLFE
jgi:murein DD-endopeptidase MepM/ murein hydrolase activator NlpD